MNQEHIMPWSPHGAQETTEGRQLGQNWLAHFHLKNDRITEVVMVFTGQMTFLPLTNNVIALKETRYPAASLKNAEGPKNSNDGLTEQGLTSH